METTERRVSPQELYAAAWRTARAAFYERSRLNDWSYWEHRYDHLMRDDQDAYRFIGEMLGSLRDNYTFLKTPQVVHDDRVNLERTPPPCSVAMWNNGIGYVHINTFAHNNFCQELFDALLCIEHARAFIVDLRRNKGGFVDSQNDAISMFCDTARVMICKTWADGTFTESYGYLNRDGFDAEYFDADGNKYKTHAWKRWRNVTAGKPVYVLIDETCASATELFAGILRDNNRAVLIGRQTYGKGIAQNTLDLPNGCGLRITNGICLPPSRQWFGDDRQTYANGVLPHVWVEHDPHYNGDKIANVAYRRLLRELDGDRGSTGTLLLAGAIGLGLALLAGTGRGGRRVA